MRAPSSTPLAGPVIGPALECEIAPKRDVPWSLDENATLLARVALRECQDRQGRPQWSQIAQCLPGRTPQEARGRWRRIRDARKCVELGETRRNRCLTCGQLRRGHICPGVTSDAAAAHQLVALREEGSASEEADEGKEHESGNGDEVGVGGDGGGGGGGGGIVGACAVACTVAEASMERPLRPATLKSSDIKHARPLKRHKSSQFRGVSIQSGQWTARINHNGKPITIGSFDTEAAYSDYSPSPS